MTSIDIYHYVYRITNLVEKKHYYGKRSSKVDPKLDLGIKYFSSSKDENFIIDQKTSPQNYRYKIVQTFCTASEAVQREILLHEEFNVGSSLNFYNRRNQSAIGFDQTGLSPSEKTRMKISLGGKGLKRSDETKSRMSIAFRGRIISKETKAKMSTAKQAYLKRLSAEEKAYLSLCQKGIVSAKFAGYYITPDGVFCSKRDCGLPSAINWCKNSQSLISRKAYVQSKYLNENYSIDIIGKSFGEIGFGFIPKELFPFITIILRDFLATHK